MCSSVCVFHKHSLSGQTFDSSYAAHRASDTTFSSESTTDKISFPSGAAVTKTTAMLHGAVSITSIALVAH